TMIVYFLPMQHKAHRPRTRAPRPHAPSNPYAPSSRSPRKRVIVVVFDGVQTLDATGPAEVFAVAARVVANVHRDDAPAAHAVSARALRGGTFYDVVIAARGGGMLATSCGLEIRVRDLAAISPRAGDTILVAGGDRAAIVDAATDRALVAWLGRAARVAERVTSVCSGAFVLAAAGLLDGKRATTHWSALDRLAQMFPRVEVDRTSIFVCDGSTWTSAGVTTGIDMALALVEADLGARVADQVAAQLVLYARRPGFQSQWSDALVAQQQARDPLAPAIAWARANLVIADLESIAKRAGLSGRTFHRRCVEHLSTTPAKLLDKLRVERARELLATSDEPIKSLAVTCGWGAAARMTRAFERELGMSPRAYRLLHT
ncbi:MAG: GlxA family transcriptional regulator, partial [Kofleriaceae bacterium]